MPLRLILGSGRSGTTWVLDSLAEANALRPIFEPLHPAESAYGRNYAYQLLANGDEDRTLEHWFRDVSAGRVHSRWTDYRGSTNLLFPGLGEFMRPGHAKSWLHRWRKYLRDRRSLMSATRRNETLIKCIRANLMAGWLTRSVGFNTVLIVRHPCAVVESQHRLGGHTWDPMPTLEGYRANRRLHEITDGRYVSLLNSDLTTLQALTLNWIIENQWPIERSRDDGYTVFYYEDLVEMQGNSWRGLCAALALEHVPDARTLGQRSQMTFTISGESAQPIGEPRWRQRLTSEQCATVQAILDATEFGIYNVNEAGPAVALRFSTEKGEWRA